MNISSLMDNPGLKDISPEKMQFLLDFATKNENRSPKDMIPFFMAASKSAKNNGIDFSNSEVSLIIEIMKQNMTPEEQKKVDMILSMFEKHKKTN